MKKITLIISEDTEIRLVVESKTGRQTIANLMDGETAYTTPWGLVIASGTFMIKSDHPVERDTGGTFSLRIKKSEGMIFVDGTTIEYSEIHRRESNSWVTGHYREAVLVPGILSHLVF